METRFGSSAVDGDSRIGCRSKRPLQLTTARPGHYRCRSCSSPRNVTRRNRLRARFARPTIPFILQWMGMARKAFYGTAPMMEFIGNKCLAELVVGILRLCHWMTGEICFLLVVRTQVSTDGRRRIPRPIGA